MNELLRKVVEGSILHCDVCGKTRKLDVEQVDRYIATGWPRHCGQEMRLITLREQKKAGTDVCT